MTGSVERESTHFNATTNTTIADIIMLAWHEAGRSGGRGGEADAMLPNKRAAWGRCRKRAQVLAAACTVNGLMKILQFLYSLHSLHLARFAPRKPNPAPSPFAITPNAYLKHMTLFLSSLGTLSTRADLRAPAFIPKSHEHTIFGGDSLALLNGGISQSSSPPRREQTSSPSAWRPCTRRRWP